MTPDISSLLMELYAIDPSLKDHEAELKPVLLELLQSRPDVTPDERFVAELRRMLQARAVERGSASSFFDFFSLFTVMPKFSYAVVGAVFGILISIPTAYYVGQKFAVPGSSEIAMHTDTPAPPAVPLFTYDVQPKDKDAFGSLSTVTLNGPTGRGGGGPEAAISARPQSGGGGDSKMIAPPGIYPFYQTTYVYKGDPLTLPDASVDVLRRVKGISSQSALASFLSLNLGLADLSTFPGSKLESFNLYQDTSEGYMISVNMKEGTINLNQNWEMWPQPNCQDQACWDRQRIKESELPSDAEAIAIADGFLKSHGITMPNIGTPFVDNSWRQGYESMQNKSDFWFPDAVSVIYPLVIDGQEVREEYGNPVGLSVSVGVRSGKVTGLWNLMDQKFESSAYDGVTDEKVILDYISSYGRPTEGTMPEGAKIEQREVELGTPTRGYAHLYRYENNKSDELYVPALIFPVTKGVADSNFYHQQSLIVPLAAELLKNRPGIPLPLMDRVVEPAVEVPTPPDMAPLPTPKVTE